MAATTKGRYEGIFNEYLKTPFGQCSLGEITPLAVQRYFSNSTNFPDLQHESKTRGTGILKGVLKSTPPPYCKAPLLVPVLNVFGAPVTRVVLSANRAYPPPTLARGEIAEVGTNVTLMPG